MIDKKTLEIIKLSKICEDILTDNTTKKELIIENAEFFIKNFLTEKENIIPKVINNSKKYKIEFNIFENKKNIWDMLFISEFISNQLPEEANKKIEKIASTIIMSLKNVFPIIVVDKTPEFKDLKKSIVILELLYEYIHDNKNLINEIDNQNLTIKCCDTTYKIPIEYLGEFGRGIVPLSKDKTISNKIDKKVLNLFYNLNLDYKELPNFYYRTHIDRINYLNELVNNNQKKLNGLPAPLFTSVVPVSWIKKILKLVDNDINKLQSLPNSIYIEQPYLDYIKELLILADNDFEKISKLPNKVFSRSSNIDRIKTIVNNTTKKKITELNNLPDSIFICSEKRLQFFIIRTKSKLNKLKGLSPKAFSSSTTEERLQLLINLVNENYKLLEDINDLTYTTTNKRLRFILQLINNDVTLLSKIPNCWFNEKTTSEKRIKYLYNLNDKDINKTISLPDIIFDEIKTSEERINFIYKITKDTISINNLPSIIFYDEVKEKTIYNLLSLTENKIERLHNIPTIFFQEKNNIREYNDILSIIVHKSRINYEDYELLFPFIKNGIEDKKFIFQRLSYLLKIIKNKKIIINLPLHMFNKYTTNVRITFILDLIKYDFTKFDLIPKELYLKHIKVTRIITLYNLVGRDFNKLANLPKEMYSFPQESLKYLYDLHLNNKAKPLIGIGNSETIISILYMMIAFSEYEEKMANPNQMFSKFEIASPDNILTIESDNISKSLNELNYIIEKLPKVLIYNSKKDFKPKLIKEIKKINNSIQNLDKVISKHNNSILEHIKNSIIQLRFHTTAQKIILEDYTISEDTYRNHVFKIEGTINDFIELTNSLIINKRLISNKEYTEEIYNSLTTNTTKKYGKRFINTVLNESTETKKVYSNIISIQSKLINQGIKEMTFYIEEDTINIGYIIGKKKYYSNIKDIFKDIENITKPNV